MKKVFLLIIVITLNASCKNTSETTPEVTVADDQTNALEEPEYQLSLAQWSLHRRYKAPDARPLEFPKDAKELGFDGIELVTQLYTKEIASLGFEKVVDSLKNELQSYGVSCILIMVDEEGDLADPDEKIRNMAVENHKKWVDAASKFGAHSIRVNTFGTNDPEVWKVTVKDGLTKLATYAATKNINVIAENHGWLSSNPPLVMQVLDEINMDNCGTLPDFGNWCIEREKGERWGACAQEYPDRYEGVEMMLRRAKGVSAKAHSFDAEGNEEKIDYYRMIQLVKDSGYKGRIGIEFESETIDEVEGINQTRTLINKAFSKTK
jgi:sugar phosphate isomerase/epimerase